MCHPSLLHTGHLTVLHKTGVSVLAGPSENMGFTSSFTYEAHDVLVDFPQAWGISL